VSINFKTKNFKLTGAMKGFTEKGLQDLEKLSGDIIDADVIINEEKLQFKVDIVVRTKFGSLNAKESDKLLKQALRLTLNSLKIQAKKHKEKIKEEKKHSAKNDFLQELVEAAAPAPGKTGKASKAGKAARSGRGQIVLSDNYSRKPLTVEEALFFLKESGENAYMFVNSESNRPAVLYITAEGTVSLIEPR
jgi:putative sigma-54 modulation protein